MSLRYMVRNKFIKGIGALAIAALFQVNNDVQAQDVHFTQFNMAPLTVNPAFTGAFDGDFRVNAIYRDQWRSALGGAAFKTYALSLDMPVIRDISIDDYLAVGVQFYNDVAGDANLSNFSALASVAYHKFLGRAGNKALTLGFQGGYTQNTLNVSKLYFGDEFTDGNWQTGTTWEQLASDNKGFVLNGGLAWSHAPSQAFSYVIGAGVNNINRPFESFNRRGTASQANRPMRMTGQVGAIYNVNERFSIRPAVLFQTQATAYELNMGSEVNYKLGDRPDLPVSPAIFLGGWYRLDDAVNITGGLEWNGFRLGFGYDYNISNLKASTNGNGGFEVALRYIQPNPLAFARKLIYPCGRF